MSGQGIASGGISNIEQEISKAEVTNEPLTRPSDTLSPLKGRGDGRAGLMAMIVLLLSTLIPSAAAELPVRLRLEPLSIRGRSSGPIPLRIKLEYNQSQILEGDLFLEIYNSLQVADDLMITLRYEGIVLSGQDLFLDTVLPPIEHSQTRQYLVVGWFETPDGRIPLTADPDRVDPPEPHELLSIATQERATLVCSCSGQRDFQQPSDARKFLDLAFSLDNYNQGNVETPDDKSARKPFPSERVQNFPANWDAIDLPEDPLALCSFDIVLLADGALSRLDEGQLAALRTWLAAGGSLCVLPNDDLLQPRHLAFLRAIFEDDQVIGPQLTLSDTSQLMVISERDEPIVNRTLGLGRATLLLGDDDLRDHLTGLALAKVVAHLWKLKHSSAVQTGGLWGATGVEKLLKERGFRLQEMEAGYVVLDREDPIYVPGADQSFDDGFSNMGGMNQAPPVYESLSQIAIDYDLMLDLAPKPSVLPAACESALLPSGIRMVPTSIIAWLLVAYVLIIGPIDYFLLGFFRLRKFTWVVFPIVTALFTALTVSMAHNYMETSDTGSRLTITDLIEDGRPVRSSQIQMQFRSAQSALTQEHTTAFTVPAQMSGEVLNAYANQRSSRPMQQQLHYSGRFPQKYVTTQNLSQWKPELTRTMTLAPVVDDIPRIDWNNITLVSTDAGRSKLRQSIQSQVSGSKRFDAIVLHQGRLYSLFPTDGFLFSMNIQQAAQQWLQQQRAALSASQYGFRSQQRIGSDVLLSAAVLESATSQGRRDFFSLVSQVSPQGSASMEDLMLLDPTDPHAWLLIVAERDGENTNIFRRLYQDRPSISVLSMTATAPTESTAEQEQP